MRHMRRGGAAQADYKRSSANFPVDASQRNTGPGFRLAASRQTAWPLFLAIAQNVRPFRCRSASPKRHALTRYHLFGAPVFGPSFVAPCSTKKHARFAYGLVNAAITALAALPLFCGYSSLLSEKVKDQYLNGFRDKYPTWINQVGFFIASSSLLSPRSAHANAL